MLGWALLQGTWQVTLLWIVVRLWTRVARPDARRRHRGALAALGASVIGVMLTIVLVHRAASDDARRFLTGLTGHDAALPPPGMRAFAAGYDIVFDLMPWLVVVWIAGACVAAARTASARRRLGALVQCGGAAPRWIVQRLTTLARIVGVSRIPDVRVVPGHGPFVYVGARSWLVLPHLEFSGAELDAILLHELAHLRRRDPIVQRAIDVVAAAYWFHPAVGSLMRAVSDAREECCDDLAIRAHVTPLTMARALVRLADDVPRASGALAAAHGALHARIRRLLALEPEWGRRSTGSNHSNGSNRSYGSATARLASAAPMRGAALLVASATIGWMTAVAPAIVVITEGRRLPVAAALAGVVPSARVRIDAHDPAGTFAVQLINGRVAAVTLGGMPVAQARVRVVGRRLQIHDAQHRLLLRASVDPRGRLAWTARALRPSGS